MLFLQPAVEGSCGDGLGALGFQRAVGHHFDLVLPGLGDAAPFPLGDGTPVHVQLASRLGGGAEVFNEFAVVHALLSTQVAAPVNLSRATCVDKQRLEAAARRIRT